MYRQSSILLIRNPMDANNALVWLTGSLYGHTIENFYSVIPWFVITLPLVLCLSYQLDILNLGEHIATALGARVQRLKMILLILSVIGRCLHFSSRRYKFSRPNCTTYR